MDIKQDIERRVNVDIEESINHLIVTTENSENVKPAHFYKNNTVGLVNEFYDKFFSLKNLKKMDWFWVLLFIGFFLISIYFTFKFSAFNSNPITYLLLIPYGITMLLYRFIIGKNEKIIVYKYNKKNGTNFSTAYEVRNAWLCSNFGTDYASLENIKKLQEWKNLRAKHPNQFKFNWRVYTYTPEAKPRIVSYTIAFITVLGLIVFNIFKAQNTDEMIAYFDAIFHTPSILGLVISILIIVVVAFYSLAFGFEIIKNLIYSFPLPNNGELSEAKFNRLMSFMVNQSEVINIKKDE